MPNFFFKDSLAYRISVIVRLVVANEVINRHGFERLDVEVQLEDGVAVVYRMLINVVRTGGGDGLTTPFNRVTRATFIGLNELIRLR